MSERSASWDLLGRINQGSGLPWCVIRDLNEIVTQDEKFGSRLRLSKQMDAFWMALEFNGLSNLGWKNKNPPGLIDTKILALLEKYWIMQ